MFALILSLVLLPIVGTVMLSLRGEGGFTLENYVRVFSTRSPDKALINLEGGLKSLLHSTAWIMIHLPVTVLLGLFPTYTLKTTY